MTRWGAVAVHMTVAYTWLESLYGYWMLQEHFVYSVQNECLQQHCKLVNRYPLSKRKGHWHFPLSSLSGMISHLSKQGASAFSTFQWLPVDRATHCH